MNKLTNWSMVMRRMFSFSIKPKDVDSIKLVEHIQLLSIKRGIKFSFIIIEGLKLYLQRELENGK